MYLFAPKKGFGKEELKDLLISALVITFIFAYPPAGGTWLVVFLIYFLFIGLGFAVHEMAHKLMAQKLGAWSEFRMWKEGLMFALVMRILGGPVFIAPGATMWAKPFASKDDHGKVSVAGPITNIAMALAFAVLGLFVPLMSIGTVINLQLAMFNLLPFPPLDGYKVMNWKPALWVLLFGASLALQWVIPAGL